MPSNPGLPNHLCCVKLAPELEKHTKCENNDKSVANIETGVVISVNKSSHGSVANAARAILEESFGNLFLPYVCNRVLEATSPTSGLAIELLYGNGYKTIVQRDRKDDDTSTVKPLKRIFVHLRISGIRTTEKERNVSSMEVLPPGEDLYEHVALHSERKDNNIGSDGVSSILWVCTGDPLFYYPRKTENESLIGISVPSNAGGYWTRGFCDPKNRQNPNGSLLQKKSAAKKKRSSLDAALDKQGNHIKKSKKKEKKSVTEESTVTATPVPISDTTISRPSKKSASKDTAKKEENRNMTVTPADPPMMRAKTLTYLKPIPVVVAEDRQYATSFLFALFKQVLICHLQETDRVQRRADNPLGMAGFACIHCIDEAKEKGSTGRYFPMARKRLADFNHSLRVYDHVMKCPKCPPDTKDGLKELRDKHSNELLALKKSQKKFFENIFVRLRMNDLSSGPVTVIPKDTPVKAEATPKKDTAEKIKKKPTVSKEEKEKEKKRLAAEAKDIIMKGVAAMERKMSSLVTSNDNTCGTRYAFYVLSQMEMYTACKDDIYGSRKENGTAEGFTGLACQHCVGDSLAGRFLLPKLACLEDDTTGIMCFHSHLQQCSKCPKEIRDALDELKEEHIKLDKNTGKGFDLDETPLKVFAGKIWARLREKDQGMM
mmetsp:Transcript_11308/g.16612  ORF Transcript_11308/g.16612 Transcript_11308/m.16612 type:complete len:660 (+) Transcript_11308:232-2211(+)|eukprot:CAMPEP_0194217034 /NCGR_PEP_ID=MMETSP0156-20130528/20157_1 /TAXON_ID=33649 /ORGANISM="Thalassionema nitzschioides, Strain L26-B" /LENGTH=659 /DNA_ID=CAMNT_0038945945 /DNA_START=130 /DNA_END=2109 /DNA_ORIENTATION=-